MSPEKAWKQAERTVARQLGGERTPLSGSNSRHTSADAIGIEEFVEHKRHKADTVHRMLTQLGQRARPRDRWPMIYFDLEDDAGPLARWVALWLDRYLQQKAENGEIPSFDESAPGWPWMVRHEVGRRLPRATLVLDTVEAAEAEGRPPLVVVSKPRSPNRVALVPIEVHPR